MESPQADLHLLFAFGVEDLLPRIFLNLLGITAFHVDGQFPQTFESSRLL